MEITTKYLDEFSDEFKKDSKNFLARNAFLKNAFFSYK